jgi:hypothetical protein
MPPSREVFAVTPNVGLPSPVCTSGRNWRACRCGHGICVSGTIRQGPSMYGMEGPCPPGGAVPPISQRPLRHSVPPKAGSPPRRRVPGTAAPQGGWPASTRRPSWAAPWRLLQRQFPGAGGSGVHRCVWGFPLRLGLPGGSRFSVVTAFLRLSRVPHKGFAEAISRFFPRPQAIHSQAPVIPREQGISHRMSTSAGHAKDGYRPAKRISGGPVSAT